MNDRRGAGYGMRRNARGTPPVTSTGGPPVLVGQVVHGSTAAAVVHGSAEGDVIHGSP
jgi:hypothetical protein